MALFGTKKKDTSKTVAAPATPKKAKATQVEKAAVKIDVKNIAGNAAIIIRPRITEKSGMLSQVGVYTFEVSKSANKNSVLSAIKSLYKIEAVKVAIINTPSRNVFIRGRRGVVPGVRKALVTVKKGDKIEFV